MIDFETKEVLFIDLDSTLIKTISGKNIFLKILQIQDTTPSIR